MNYTPEVLNDDIDDGTMPGNVRVLADAVIGRKIVSAEREKREGGLVLTLDNGTQVILANAGECCAYTELSAFLLHPELVEHVITGVGTTGGFTQWHIFADMGDVLELSVGWSCGNPFYYGYGFDISVIEKKDEK